MKSHLFTDGYVTALREFGAPFKMVQDTKVKGLQLRIGVHRMSWYYFKERRDHGKRIAACKLLGHFPQTSVAEARKAAQIEAGRIAAGRYEPGKRSAVKFDAAIAEYIDHLRRKADRLGKPQRWADNVQRLADKIMLPMWANWSLAEMSGSPAAVRDWHIKTTAAHGPISANRCCEVIRAAYRHAARLNRALPPHNPTSAVAFNQETPREIGLAFADFPKWFEAWKAIESPIRRSYHLVALLSGSRPGELARLQWPDVLPRSRSFVIRGAKAGADIPIPMSAAIARALKLARDAAKPGSDQVFPGCAKKIHRDGLPIWGNALRHTFRTVAADLKIDDLLAHFLLGHAPEGVSKKYVARLVLQAGPAMRDAQRTISRRIIQLLGLP